MIANLFHHRDLPSYAPPEWKYKRAGAIMDDLSLSIHGVSRKLLGKARCENPPLLEGDIIGLYKGTDGRVGKQWLGRVHTHDNEIGEVQYVLLFEMMPVNCYGLSLRLDDE